MCAYLHVCARMCAYVRICICGRVQSRPNQSPTQTNTAFRKCSKRTSTLCHTHNNNAKASKLNGCLHTCSALQLNGLGFRDNGLGFRHCNAVCSRTQIFTNTAVCSHDTPRTQLFERNCLLTQHTLLPPNSRRPNACAEDLDMAHTQPHTQRK